MLFGTYWLKIAIFPEKIAWKNACKLKYVFGVNATDLGSLTNEHLLIGK